MIGFVPKEKIPKNKILGEGNMVFFPTEGDVVSTFGYFREFVTL